MRIIYRGVYAGFPAAALHLGDLAHATDLLVLYISDSVAWVPYHDYPDYQGEKQGLYDKPAWAAVEGEDISFAANFAAIAPNVGVGVNFPVPAGRTLYINQVAFSCNANLVADNDNNQMCQVIVQSGPPWVPFISQGGNGGGQAIFSVPQVIPALLTFMIDLYNRANHNCDLSFVATGYLV